MLHPDYPIATERLLLRPATVADIDAMHAYKSRAEVCRYLPYAPMSRDEVAERVEGLWARTELTEVGQGLNLCVEEKASGRLLGDVVLFWRDAESRMGEIGYVFSPEAAGHGYATEAAAALLRLGFDGLSLHRVTARIDARNHASARVLDRLGMRREAVHLHDMWLENEWSDTVVYALLEDEWRAAGR
ncbi:RimJ/RimL family protein N-acetyltransferase [Nocardia tenerifensis]|uniref:RimJ/RimL family protein N-acetyltransferase n=1 Tax=Nocardia tenerifensis TaxID=228006 RepID=A0A318JVG2_9NOCA|nr:GNAT family N-acetyltransferase [Nocardia tenerifensis]PXX61021.1 RimJ/RimL family protein N-acetyltransferase [Nocardia tenerifensis]